MAKPKVDFKTVLKKGKEAVQNVRQKGVRQAAKEAGKQAAREVGKAVVSGVFSGVIKGIRKSKNLRQVDVARPMGITSRELRNWEKGVHTPNLVTQVGATTIIAGMPSRPKKSKG